MVESSKKSERLGFIGVGAMGLPMVERLIAAGHCPIVWDVSPQRLKAACHAAANVAGSAAEVVRSAGIVFLCLTDASAVEAVVLDVGADRKLTHL